MKGIIAPHKQQLDHNFPVQKKIIFTVFVCLLANLSALFFQDSLVVSCTNGKQTCGSLTIFVVAPKSRFKKMTILLKIIRLWNLKSFVKTGAERLRYGRIKLIFNKLHFWKPSSVRIFILLAEYWL